MLVNVGLRRKLGAVFNRLSTYYQWVFRGITPEIIQKATLWYYRNYGRGGAAVDLQIKNTQVATFDGVGTYVDSGIKIQGGQLIDLDFYVYFDGTGGQTFCSCGANSTTTQGLLLWSLLGTDLRLFTSNGTARNIVEFSNIFTGVGWYNIKFNWSGITGAVATVNVNGDIRTDNNTLEWIGDSTYNLLIGAYDLTPQNVFSGMFAKFIALNYFEYNFQSGKGLEIKNRLNPNLPGTFTGGIEPDFWANKSEFAEPVLNKYGGSNYAVNDVAGTASMLGATDGSNLGSEELINGDFSLGVTGWLSVRATPDASGGFAKITNTDPVLNGYITQSYSTVIGIAYKYSANYLDSPNALGNSSFRVGTLAGSGNIILNNISNIKKAEFIEGIFTATATTTYISLYNDTGLSIHNWDNVSVKKATAISLTSIFNYRLKPTIFKVWWLDSTDPTSGNGYMLETTPTSITLNRVDAGVLAQLDTAVITYNDYDLITPEFTGSGITIDLEGVEKLTSNDTTYPNFKIIVTEGQVGDSISHFTKNGIKYNIADNLCNGTGEWGIRRAIGVDGVTDVDGNPLEYPPNCVWPSGNTYLEPDDIGLNTIFDFYAELAVLKNPNEFDYSDLVAIDTSGIPETDFDIKINKDQCVRDMVIAPYEFEALRDSNGDLIYDSNAELIYPLKEFS